MLWRFKGKWTDLGYKIETDLGYNHEIRKEEQMKPKASQSPESVVREIKRKTRRKFNSEEKIRIVLEGLKGEDSIAAICRREGIAPSLYYKWSKTFLQAGKRRLDGDTIREANSDEVSELRRENEELKQLVAELSLKNRVFKKSLNGLE